MKFNLEEFYRKGKISMRFDGYFAYPDKDPTGEQPGMRSDEESDQEMPEEESDSADHYDPSKEEESDDCSSSESDVHLDTLDDYDKQKLLRFASFVQALQNGKHSLLEPHHLFEHMFDQDNPFKALFTRLNSIIVTRAKSELTNPSSLFNLSTCKPELRISITDFHPSTIDQDKIVEFIEDFPMFAYLFDFTWYMFDKDELFHCYTIDRKEFERRLTSCRLLEAKYDNFARISPDFWIELATQREKELSGDYNARILPGVVENFPKRLWEEETRQLRKKETDFTNMLSKLGNNEAKQFFEARNNSINTAKDSLNSMMSELDDIIAKKDDNMYWDD